MNALELLRSDHKVVAELFKKAESASDKEKPAIFSKIKDELDVHTHIEETIFYPKLKADGNKALVDIVLEGIEEHRQVKMFLKELEGLTGGSEKFDPKLTVLIEDVEHHVKEEENEMFPLVKDQFDDAVMEELGKRMETEKANFKRSLSATA